MKKTLKKLEELVLGEIVWFTIVITTMTLVNMTVGNISIAIGIIGTVSGLVSGFVILVNVSVSALINRVRDNKRP